MNQAAILKEKESSSWLGLKIIRLVMSSFGSIFYHISGVIGSRGLNERSFYQIKNLYSNYIHYLNKLLDTNILVFITPLKFFFMYRSGRFQSL